MTKRKNPFDDSHFLQKLHVGVKEVNLGVNHVENMKKVYGSYQFSTFYDLKFL